MDDTQYVRGASKLAQRIRTIRATLGVGALVNEVGELLLRRTLVRFDKEVDPDNRPWEALASTTLERRRRKGGQTGKKILVQTSALRDSIQLIRGQLSGALAVNTGAGVRIGVAEDDQVGKAAAHQLGIGLPVRRFLGVSRLDVTAVDGLLRRRARAVEKLL